VFKPSNSPILDKTLIVIKSSRPPLSLIVIYLMNLFCASSRWSSSSLCNSSIVFFSVPVNTWFVKKCHFNGCYKVRKSFRRVFIYFYGGRRLCQYNENYFRFQSSFLTAWIWYLCSTELPTLVSSNKYGQLLLTVQQHCFKFIIPGSQLEQGSKLTTTFIEWNSYNIWSWLDTVL